MNTTELANSESENAKSKVPYHQTLLRSRVTESFRITPEMKIEALSDDIFNTPQQVTVEGEIVKFTNDWHAQVGDHLVLDNGKVCLVSADRYKNMFTDLNSQYGQFNIAVSEDRTDIVSWLNRIRGDRLDIIHLKKTGIGNDATWNVVSCVELHARTLQQLGIFHAIIDVTIQKAKEIDPQGWDHI